MSQTKTRGPDLQVECPRCREPASGTARRRGHCTACGAHLGAAAAPKQADVRAYLYPLHQGVVLHSQMWPR